MSSMPWRAKEVTSREVNALRRELDEIRAAIMSIRTLLVAATVVGAGYDTVATNLSGTTANTAVSPPRFTRL